MMSTVTLFRVAARFFHWDINTSASEKPTAFPNRSDFPLRRGSRVESVPFLRKFPLLCSTKCLSFQTNN